MSPGIIDLNVRREFENYTFLTKAAVAGGVTFILEEDGYYAETPPYGELYCDIGKISVIDRNNLGTMELAVTKGCLAYKGYFFPPSSNTLALPSDLFKLLKDIHKTGLPLFIDPTMPDPRMLYMASPMRLESVKSRSEMSKPGNMNVFAAAFSNAIESEGENEDEESEESPHDSFKRRSFHEDSDMPHQSPINKSRSNSVESLTFELVYHNHQSDLVFPEIPEVEEESTPIKMKRKRNHKSRTGIYTIFDDLDKRIRENQQNIQNLSLAEQTTYNESGQTEFSKPPRKKSASLGPVELNFSDSDSSDTGIIHIPKSADTFQKRMCDRRPGSLQIESKKPNNNNKERIYIYHLANYPDYWEISGVEMLLQNLNQDFPVHMVNISSAAAINKIRQARDHFPRLTCEISASQLYFTNNSIQDGQTIFKNSPPIRNTSNCNLLWDLLKMKAIDCVTSQHAYIDPRNKAFETGDFQKALNGISSIGFTLQAI